MSTLVYRFLFTNLRKKLCLDLSYDIDHSPLLAISVFLLAITQQGRLERCVEPLHDIRSLSLLLLL